MKQFKKINSIQKVKSVLGEGRYGLSIFLVLFGFVCLAVALYMPNNNLKFNVGEIVPLNSGWTLTYPNAASKISDLPLTIDLPKNDLIKIEKELPGDFRLPQTLRLRASMQEINVYLDHKQIYTNESPDRKGFFYQPQVSAWHLVELPENSDGQLIEITIRSDVQAMSGITNAIYYGQKSDLIGDLIARQPLALGIAVFIIVIGCLSNIVSWKIRLNSTNRLNYLSIFALTIGIWLVSEMDIMQIFTGNSYVVGTISYLVLPIAAIAFLLFIREVALLKYAKVINHFAFFIGIYLVTSMVMQLTMNLHYFNAFLFFTPMILLAGLMVTSLLVFESLWHHDLVAQKYLKIISVMIVTVVVEVVKFLVGDFMDVSYIGNFGIAIFLLLLIFDTVKYVNGVLQKEGQTRYLEEIAYKDILTGGRNRSSFEQAIDGLLALKEPQAFRLIMFDLNNLKLINDHYGHHYGDQALKDFYGCLATAFGDTSTCYRIGGDEFMVIVTSTSDDVFDQGLISLDQQMKEIESRCDYQFTCAHGSGIYKYDQSFGEFKHDVDMKMYRLKERQKLVGKN